MNITKFSQDISNDDKSFVTNKVTLFNQFYSGDCPQYHRFRLGKKKNEYKIISLNMTKQIGEDNASLIINENLSFNVQDNVVKNFLLGDDDSFRGGELGRINFWEEIVKATEKLYSYSGSVLLTYLPNYFLDNCPFKDGGFKFKILTTLDFAVSKCGRRVYFESDIVDKDGNPRIFKIENKREVYLDDDYLGQTDYDCVFQLNTAAANNFYQNSNFTIAPQMNALAWLVFCDLVSNNFRLDFDLGKKSIFIKQDYLSTEFSKDKEVLESSLPDLIYTIPSSNEMKDTLMKEFNPTIRTPENKEGLNFGLQRLGEKVGFGKKFYQADETGHITAYQTRVSNYALTYYLEKQRTNYRSVLPKFCNAVAIANGLSPTIIDCTFDDRALSDPDTERKDDVALVTAGLMSKVEFRQKWFKETPDEAAAKLALIDAERPTFSGFSFD